jgi:two-component system, NtrC family, nitrogen regulation sensor histidine kinase NtrY
VIQNAIQSIQEKGIRGKINIELKKKDSFWCISFADNGTGIPQDRHEKIFQPNFTTKTSGTGLGLAICKSIIDRIGGKIWLDSTEGEGSEFYIEIPEITEDAETE